MSQLSSSKKEILHYLTNTVHEIINKLTRSSSASSEDEEKRRPFFSTLTSSLMLQESKRFDQLMKRTYCMYFKK